LDPGYPLKPYQFERSRRVPDFCHQPPGPLFADRLQAGQPARQLDKISLGADVADEGNFGPVQVPVGKMYQEVPKRKDPQLLFQQIGALGAYAFEVLNGVG
jgi:hypothetical protein